MSSSANDADVLQLVETGTFVVPGDVVYTSSNLLQKKKKKTATQAAAAAAGGEEDEEEESSTAVLVGEGCMETTVSSLSDASDGGCNDDRKTKKKQRTEKQASEAKPDGGIGDDGVVVSTVVVATAAGYVHWEDNSVSVIRHVASASTRPGKHATTTINAAAASATLAVKPDASTTAAGAIGTSPVSGKAAVAPTAGAAVLVRIQRVGRTMANGTIIAVGNQWCCSSSSVGGGGGGGAGGGMFRGMFRTEDVRPFKPSEAQPQPLPLSASFRPGDVIRALCISQSDVRQYQLSTMGEGFGVIEATSTTRGSSGVAAASFANISGGGVGGGGGGSGGLLQPVSGRRDLMKDPSTGQTVSRWAPLITASTAATATM